MKRTKLIRLSLLFLLCLAMTALLAACSGGGDNQNNYSAYAGKYYRYIDDVKQSESWIELKSDGNWTGSASSTGTYSVSGENITINPDASDDNSELMNGTIKNGVITITYAGITVIYKKDDGGNGGQSTGFTVSFDVDGGTSIPSQSITSGGTATRPATDPTKDGAFFVGWYKDSGKRTTFDFSTQITINMTVYAKWNELSFSPLNGGAEYKVISLSTFAGISELIIPATYKGKPVTAIGDNAFSACNDIMSLTIPDSITSIGTNAFAGAMNLTGLIIPDSVTSIGLGAFSNADKLESITLPFVGASKDDFGNAFIGYIFAFDISFHNMLVPLTLRTVTVTQSFTGGKGAFSNCQFLTSITLPENQTNKMTVIEENTFSGCRNLTSLTIPDTVTSIGNGAFANCSSLTGIIIPDSVRSIGEFAFSDCSGLTGITIPSSVTSIGNAAFNGCSGLSGIIIPDGVTSLSDTVFQGCRGLTDIAIHNKVTSIGAGAFSGCTSLIGITIPNSVTNIGSDAFSGCTGLTDVTISKSVTGIDGSLFYGCTSLVSISIPFVGQSAEVTGNTSYRYFSYIFGGNYSVPSSLKTVVITGGTRVGDDAFAGCGNLTSITLPEGLLDIGINAFRDCTSLKNIAIPDSVTSIGLNALYGCTSLESVTLPFVGTTKDSLYNGNFDYIFGNYFANVPATLKTVVITGGTIIRANAFYNCSSLTSITIPDSVTEIGVAAFSGCGNLTSITIPNSVTKIGAHTFSGCSSLVSITLPFIGTTLNGTSNTHLGIIFGASSYFEHSSYVPASLKTVIITGGNSIATYAFIYCGNLTDITISNSVTSIDLSAFMYCDSIKSIAVEESSSYFSSQDGVLYNKNKTTLVYYPAGKAASTFTIPGSVTNIGEAAFRDRVNLTGIIIPDSVINIGEAAFESCINLNGLTIPNSVTSIGSFAFYNCSSLTEVIIPGSVTSIGYWAFGECNSLASITIPFVGATLNGTSDTNFDYILDIVPSSLKTVIITGGNKIDNYAFSNRGSGLTSIIIPDSVTSIGSRAFYGCSGLTSIIIPNSVTSIGFEAFRGCSSLTSITLPFVGAVLNQTGNTYFGYIFGASNYNSNSSYVPSSLKSVLIAGGNGIYDNAFYGCSSLTSIIIPNSVTSIGYSAFAGCSSLISMTLPFVGATLNGTSNTSLGYIFGGNNSVSVPSSLKTVMITGGNKIGSSAFSDCSGLTSIIIPNSVTSIDNRAFYGCSGLTSIIIPNGVTSIGNNAFTACSGLANIIIPNSVMGIGDEAFTGCSSLTGIIIPTGVVTIGNRVFTNCSNLAGIILPDSLTSIGSSVFGGCNNLLSITIPNSVISIGSETFRGANRISIYAEASSKPSGWVSSWNVDFRPVVWGCVLSEDKSFVISFVKDSGSISNANSLYGIYAPYRKGYTFGGWSVAEGGTTADYTAANVSNAVDGTTLYAIWIAE